VPLRSERLFSGGGQRGPEVREEKGEVLEIEEVKIIYTL
jgi:hypothetical protein